MKLTAIGKVARVFPNTVLRNVRARELRNARAGRAIARGKWARGEDLSVLSYLQNDGFLDVSRPRHDRIVSRLLRLTSTIISPCREHLACVMNGARGGCGMQRGLRHKNAPREAYADSQSNENYTTQKGKYLRNKKIFARREPMLCLFILIWKRFFLNKEICIFLRPFGFSVKAELVRSVQIKEYGVQ